MNTSDDELEAFKSQINLAEYATTQGYEIDRRTSSRNSLAMKHANGDKILIGMGDDNHWIYCSVKDSSNNGSVIDFIQQTQGGNLGQVRQLLRPWLQGHAPTPPPLSPASSDVWRLEPVTKDLPAVRARLAQMQPMAGHHAYLVDERKIPMEILTHPRLRGRVLVDDRNNAVFPHWNKDRQQCGYELKNSGFTGFAPGGVKGLWGTGKQAGDTQLVIAETAIDALSYAALHGLDNSRLVSTAGAMNPQQPPLLRQAIAKMGSGSQVIVAVDHDEGGDAIAEQLEAIYGALRRSDIAFKRHSPPVEGQDWNDALRASMDETEPTPGL